MLDKDETFWMQRARVNWMIEGDRNTIFPCTCNAKEKKETLLKG